MTIPVYPSTFPCPLISNYSVSVDMGVLRFDSNNGAARQRKKFSVMPHTINMSFAIAIAELSVWQVWVNEYAYDWILFPAVTYQTADPRRPRNSQQVTRFISNLSYTPISRDYVQISVSAETAPPSVTATGNESLWIVAGEPEEPSASLVDPGTTDDPATPA